MPEHNLKKNTDMTTEKQEVVCVNVLPEVTENPFLLSENDNTCRASLVFQYKNACITLQDGFNVQTLLKLLNVLQEVSC